MKITPQWLNANKACKEGRDWFLCQKENNIKKVVQSLINEDHLNWANWVLVHFFNKKNNIRYTIYAAESVLPIFEKEYPHDLRPRQAIEAAKAVLKRNTKQNRKSAYDAYAAAYAVYGAAYAAAYVVDAAKAAVYAAYAAAYVAYVVDAAKAAVYGAAYAAAYAAYAAKVESEIQIKIIAYGMSLLEKQK